MPGDTGFVPGSGRSPGEGNGDPLQYSCQGSPMDRGAWQAIVHGWQRAGHDQATNTFYASLWQSRKLIGWKPLFKYNYSYTYVYTQTCIYR